MIFEQNIKNILEKSKNPILKLLLSNDSKEIDFIDYKNNLFSYLENKNITNDTLEHNFVSTKRINIKPGRFINKLFPNKFLANEIEIAIQELQSNFVTNKDINILEGEDIVKFYHHSMNEANCKIMEGTGTINKSCSGHAKNIELYKDNSNIKMVVLNSTNEPGKIKARALVWTLLDGSIFMDRTYTVNPKDAYVLREWAIQKGYFYRSHDSAGSSEVMFDGKIVQKDLIVKLEKWDYDGFPYVDTINFLDKEAGVLSSKCPENKENILLLQLYGGRGGWVQMWDGLKVNPKRDPYNSNDWN